MTQKPHRQFTMDKTDLKEEKNIHTPDNEREDKFLNK